MTDRPSVGDFCGTGKACGLRTMSALCVLLLVSACTYGVKPSARDVSKEVQAQTEQEARQWLARKGFRPLRPEVTAFKTENHNCLEKFDPPFYTFVQFGDVFVRVCFDQQGPPIVLARSHDERDWREVSPNKGDSISMTTRERLVQ
ncbi:hypothetical protein [uncultured Tateyamaria sp.]|uniref:hypothetical protein n=1 Tax=uncultured Tateyamaria sp. TaxID=455651 RepID=UPI00262706CD|nr:hypothetical protein [uncultured Tateyamaria sp.]